MNKTFKYLWSVVVLMGAMAFVACGDDDAKDEPTPETVTAVSMDMTISIPLSDNLLKYCLGNITYTDAQGQEVEEDLVGNSNIVNNVWTKEVKNVALPANVHYVITFKAKDADAIDQTVTKPLASTIVYQLKDANGKNVGNAQTKTFDVIGTDPAFTLNSRQQCTISHAFALYENGTFSYGSDNQSIGGMPTISFEYQKLNDLGFWVGEQNVNGYDSWGSTVYPCEYKESYMTFNTTYGVSYWSGYAISNRTKTGFEFGNFTPEGMPDQFNNVTGKAHTGNNFCVIQPYGETVNVGRGDGLELKGFWYTNSSYTVYAIENGDGMSTVPGAFTKDDWFKCTVTGMKADSTTVSVDIMLAKDGKYVNDWQYVDLSSMGKIKSLSFSFDGTKKNDYGVTTPGYICIDDLEF